jgi:hypothetical protein
VVESETAFIAVITGFHVLGLVLLGLMLWMAFRSDAPTPPRDEDSGGGEGGPGRPPDPDPVAPSGGLPLPDAGPARVRLREPARLGDLLPASQRRPAHVPGREREPV